MCIFNINLCIRVGYFNLFFFFFGVVTCVHVTKSMKFNFIFFCSFCDSYNVKIEKKKFE
jgi:hypothetical protein